MLARPLLSEILDNDALTRGLGDPEARILVEWLVERTERLARFENSESCIQHEVRIICRRARAISRFVILWSQPRERGAAVQLAAAERFTWPLPCTTLDPCELILFILDWETRQLGLPS
jgi:hypothetical protein